MRIEITICEMLERSNNWNALCDEIGLNPWCLNEGLANGDEIYHLDRDVAERYGII